MVGGGGARLDAEARGAGAGKLLRVNPWHHAVMPARRQHAAAIFNAEGASVAEAVDEFRQPLLRHRGNQPADDFVHIRGRSPLKTRGERMSGKQRRDQIQSRVRLQKSNDSQDLHLLREVQPIAAFHFDRGRAVCRKLVEKGSRSLRQRCDASPSNLLRGGLNPAAGACDFLVSLAAQAQVVFVHPAAGKD